MMPRPDRRGDGTSRTRHGGPATNLGPAARGEGVGRRVHRSPTSIYGEETPLPQPLVEPVEPPPSRGYGKAKGRAEQAVWAGPAEGLPAVVLRPVSVFGP